MYESFWVIFIIGLGLFSLTVILVRLWALKKKNYWKNQKMPYAESRLLFGTFGPTFLLKKCIIDAFSDIYKDREEHVIGVNIFHKPALMVKNHELIKRILLEDKSFFVSGDGHSSVKVENSINYKYVTERQEMDEFLFKLESVLSSVTTSSEKSLVREVYETEIVQTGKELIEYCSESKSLNVNDLVSYFVVNVIVKLIYNEDAHCLSNPKSTYRKHKNEVFKESQVSNWLWKSCKIKKHNFIWKKKLLEVLKCEDNSSLSQILRGIKEASDESGLDLHTLESVVYILVDELRQSASTLVFALYELARNEECQEKLRNELKEKFDKNSLDFGYVSDTNTYLHNVIKETLRLHPSPSVLKRDCDFPDDEEDGYSLSPFYDFKVPRKMSLLIPVHAILRDDQHFEEPDTFNPDRYTKTHEILPVFLNHKLEGSNTTTLVNCVLKVFLSGILRNFKIKASDERKQGVKYHPTSLLKLPKEPVLIDFEQL